MTTKVTTRKEWHRPPVVSGGSVATITKGFDAVDLPDSTEVVIPFDTVLADPGGWVTVADVGDIPAGAGIEIPADGDYLVNDDPFLTAGAGPYRQVIRARRGGDDIDLVETSREVRDTATVELDGGRTWDTTTTNWVQGHDVGALSSGTPASGTASGSPSFDTGPNWRSHVLENFNAVRWSGLQHQAVGTHYDVVDAKSGVVLTFDVGTVGRARIRFDLVGVIGAGTPSGGSGTPATSDIPAIDWTLYQVDIGSADLGALDDGGQAAVDLDAYTKTVLTTGTFPGGAATQSVDVTVDVPASGLLQLFLAVDIPSSWQRKSNSTVQLGSPLAPAWDWPDSGVTITAYGGWGLRSLDTPTVEASPVLYNADLPATKRVALLEGDIVHVVAEQLTGSPTGYIGYSMLQVQKFG